MKRIPSLLAQATASTGVSNSQEKQLNGTFIIPQNDLLTVSIPSAEWNLHFHASVNAGSTTSLYTKIYSCSFTGSDRVLRGTTNPVVLSTTVGSEYNSNGTISGFTLPINYRIQMEMWVVNSSANTRTVTVEFEGLNHASYLSTPIPIIPPVAGTTLLSSVYLSSSSGSITFDNIPQYFDQLRLIGYGRTTDVALQSAILLRFNGDSASNYYSQISERFGTSSSIYFVQTTGIPISNFPGAGMTALVPGTFKTDIPMYRNTGFYRSLGVTNAGYAGLTGGAGMLKTVEGTWANSNPITKLSLVSSSGGSFVTDSYFTLYGTI